jgi:hypothetical protein
MRHFLTASEAPDTKSVAYSPTWHLSRKDIHSHTALKLLRFHDAASKQQNVKILLSTLQKC